MTKRYLEIDSTYRDRVLWPSPAMFEIHLSQTGLKGASTALDPVSTAAPILEWTSNEFVNDVAATITVAGTPLTTGVGNARSPNVLIMESTGANEFQPEENYYRNAVVENAAGDRARIVDYTYLGNDIGRFTLDPPIDDFGPGPITISDPTDLSTRRVFVPTGERRENAYVGYILYNETLDEFATITAYDPVTGLVTLDDDSDISAWLPTHRFSVRRSPPLYDTTAGAGSTTNEVNIGAQGNNFTPIVGSFIRVQQTTAVEMPPQNDSRRIVAYDSVTNIATVYPPFSATTLNEEIEILPFSYDNFTPFVYTGSAQFEDSFYEIRLVSLTLPANVPLTTRNGGVIDTTTSSFYLELSDVANHNYYSPIYTNNPNASRALFRVSYYNFDASESPSREFVHFVGDDARQVMKFRVETNLRFRVFTRDGETLTFSIPERFSPAEPERRIQITALFEFVKTH